MDEGRGSGTRLLQAAEEPGNAPSRERLRNRGRRGRAREIDTRNTGRAQVALCCDMSRNRDAQSIRDRSQIIPPNLEPILAPAAPNVTGAASNSELSVE